MRNALYILGELTDGDIEWLTSVGSKANIPAGEDLIQEGESVDGLYILLDGALSVVIVAQGGLEVARLDKGEMVGEMSFIEASPPSATVRATMDSIVLMIPRERLTYKLRQDDGFAARFYRAMTLLLSHRLRVTTAQLHGGTPSLDSNLPDPDELDVNVLDNVYLAGSRFERIMKRLLES